MRLYIFIVSLILSSTILNAQNINSKKELKPGKCYERFFDYEKPIQWKEINCIVESNNISVFDVRKTEKEQVEFVKYQEKLIGLGYKLNANGILDNKTIKAHHKYLKNKNKQKRKATHRNRKKS